MESAEIIIARLVLGYLKDEKCRSSYKEFLKTSSHLQDHKIATAKYIPTRFLGLTLGDILTEYFEISQIVQGRLESTSYYDEHHPKSSLQQQVLYLLNRVQSSRASTPCPRSPTDLHVVDGSPHREHSDVETTPAHTLPGNVQYESEESVCHKTPKRNGHKYAKCLDTSSSQVEQDQTPELIDTEDLAKSLLENTEFHEKIAQTINKVAEKQHRVSTELDKTIKTVVQETEQDPIFDKILAEIIGSSGLLDDNKGLDSNSATSCVRENIEHKERKAHRDVDQHPQHVSAETSHPVDQGSRVETRTNHVTQGNQQAVSQHPVSQQTVVRQDNNEVIVFNGPLEKYLGSTANTNTNITQPQPAQNPVFINTTCTGLLIPTVQSSSQIVLLNQQSPAPWHASSAYLTQQDIMSMPTVIVNDNANTGKQQQKNLLPTTAMPTIEIPNLSEFLDFHPRVEKPKKGLKKVIYPVSAPKPNATSDTRIVDSCTALPKPSASSYTNTVESGTAKESSVKKLPDLTGEIIEENETEPVVKTPPPLETIKKTTPKSGSHIRNLDFSTPPKITSTNKKHIDQNHAKASFVHKKQAAKSLFRKEESKNKNPNEPKNSWDRDLRAALPETSPRKVKKVYKNKRKSKKAKLNSTAQDAAILEAALKTPVKKEEPQEAAVVKPSEETKPESKEKKLGSENKTILSPSKLNNSKRNIMNVKDGDEEQDKSKFVTPETSKESSNLPIKANRNITRMLDTPLKDQNIPKTPGIQTPGDHNLSMIGNFTPFAKMLEANLKGIDIDSMPTPSIPITPNFPPFTPTVDLISPYSNRPTDYSTGGSSYYLPSDNEQNKSLEAQLKQEEKKPVGKANKKDSHLDIFNRNVIGKKNLSLMRQSISSPSSSSSNDTSSDSKDESWGDKGSNDTIIFNEKETPRKYSLRTRKIPETTETKSKGTKASDKKKLKDVKKDKIVKAKKILKDKKEIVEKKAKAKVHKEHCEVPIDENKIKEREEKDEAVEEKTTKTEPEEKPSTLNDEKAALPEELLEKMHAIEAVPEEQMEISKTKHEEKQVQVIQSTCDEIASTLEGLDEKTEINDNGTTKKTSANKKDVKKEPKTKEVMPSTLSDTNVSMLRKLEEKRQRMIKAIVDSKQENGSPCKKPQRTHKFKIKPIPNLTYNRKKLSPKKNAQPKKAAPAKKTPKKSPKPKISEKTMNVLRSDLYDSESDDNISLRPSPCVDEANSSVVAQTTKPSASDVEAQNLIEGLKERGIHLMQNKSPKKKTEAQDEQNCSSSSQIFTVPKEVFDHKFKEGEDLHVVFDDTGSETLDNDLERFKELDKKFIGKVFIEELGKEVDILLMFTDCISLLDIPTKIEEAEEVKAVESHKKIVIQEVVVIKEVNNVQAVQEETIDSCTKENEVIGPESEKEPVPATDHVIEDDLMDFAATGTDELKTSSPKSARKRKLSEDGKDHTEKKAKKILKRLDVDLFLNNIHAHTNFHVKK